MPAISTIIAGVGVAASVGSGISQMSAQRKAAKAAQANATRNNAIQSDQFSQVKQMYSPYIAGGEKSFNMFNNSTGVNGEQAAKEALNTFYNVSPDYAEALKVGTNNVLQTSANSGSLLSGARLKGVMDFGGSTFNRYLQQWRENLLGGARIGIGGADRVAQAGQTFADRTSDNNNMATSARISSYAGQADALTGMAQNVTDIGGWWAGKRFPDFGSSSPQPAAKPSSYTTNPSLTNMYKRQPTPFLPTG